MTNQHPITPPPELVEKWHDAWIDAKIKHDGLIDFLAAQAAQWGADQELEACLAEVSFFDSRVLADKIRNTRRPKPPSLKEQALALLQPGEPRLFNSEMQDTIRRALEALPE